MFSPFFLVNSRSALLDGAKFNINGQEPMGTDHRHPKYCKNNGTIGARGSEKICVYSLNYPITGCRKVYLYICCQSMAHALDHSIQTIVSDYLVWYDN
jgi:hypothetical protein